MEVRCPDCKEKFPLDVLDFDEGDLLNCPECNLELTVVRKKRDKYSVKNAKDKYLEEHEFDDFYEDEDEAEAEDDE